MAEQDDPLVTLFSVGGFLYFDKIDVDKRGTRTVPVVKPHVVHGTARCWRGAPPRCTTAVHHRGAPPRCTTAVHGVVHGALRTYRAVVPRGAGKLLAVHALSSTWDDSAEAHASQGLQLAASVRLRDESHSDESLFSILEADNR